MSKTVFFQGGTLVVQHEGEQEPLSAPFQFIKGRWRCEGYHYRELAAYLREQGIRDNVRRWQPLDLTLQEKREPHNYQLEALAAWDEAGRCGSIVLPTGAGKTFLAIQAIQRVNLSPAERARYDADYVSISTLCANDNCHGDMARAG